MSITSLGLLFDIAGVIIIYFYGIIEPLDKDGKDFLGLSSDINKKELLDYESRMNLSHYGLLLLITGFALQLLGSSK